MDQAAALLNDVAKADYTYVAQLPYLKSAYNKLLLRLQDNGVPVVEEISTAINVAANATYVASPADLIQPIKLEERLDNTSELYRLVEKIDAIPELEQLDYIAVWNWREEVIYINPPRLAREVKLTYIKSFTALVDFNSSIPIINSQEYLANKTAALCARFVGENPTRADQLDNEAAEALSLMIGVEVKAKQSNPVRPKGYGYSARRLV